MLIPFKGTWSEWLILMILMFIIGAIWKKITGHD